MAFATRRPVLLHCGSHVWPEGCARIPGYAAWALAGRRRRGKHDACPGLRLVVKRGVSPTVPTTLSPVVRGESELAERARDAQRELHVIDAEHRCEDRSHVAFLLARQDIRVPAADREHAPGPHDVPSRQQPLPARDRQQIDLELNR